MNILQPRKFSPPITNRGVGLREATGEKIPTKFSFDWLRITIFNTHPELVPLLKILGVEGQLENSGHGGIGFQTVYQGIHGFQLYTDPCQSDKLYCSINLPGQFIQNLGHDRVQAMFRWLTEQAAKGQRFQVSRLDLAFDTQDFTTQQFSSALGLGKVESNARSHNEIRGSDGHTIYVGDRQSPAMLRVYHKTDGHSFDDQPFTRVELELKAERATDAFLQICSQPLNSWSSVAAAFLNGFVEVHTGWWQQWKLTAQKAWLLLKRPVATIERAAAWLQSQVAPTLATVVAAMLRHDPEAREKVIDSLLDVGFQHLRPHHSAMIYQYQPTGSPSFVKA